MRRRALLLVLAASLAAGCASSIQQLPPTDNGEPWDKVLTTCPEPQSALREIPRVRVLKLGRPVPHPPGPWRPVVIYPNPRREKLHPALRHQLATPHHAVRETLLVTFRETVTIPRFPALNEHEPRSSAFNDARLLQSRLLVRHIAALRDSSYQADSTDLVRHFGATVFHRHWLTHSLLIAMSLDSVPALATRPHVVYIQPRVGTEGPPSCPPTSSTADNHYNGDDPIEARSLIQSDSYRNLGLSYGYMSLLDTGVWTGHKLLSGVTFGVAGDCVNGGTDCVTSTGVALSTTDQCAANGGHGTGSAALLVGSASLGDRWRGALDATLDYFQVFAPGDCGGECGLCLDADAVCHGFETAVSSLDRVIVAEMSSLTPDQAAVGMNAINAFHAGAAVIAANGNAGPGTASATSPGAASCAIGVGSRDILALGQTESSQSLGPASGGRIKPDIQAPTGTETAKTMETGCARVDLLHTHTGTSGATPYAGAAAALLRNWMKAGDFDVAPGHIYAGLILSGRHYGENLNNTEGAGLIELPTDGCAWWGTGLVSPTFHWVVPLDLSSVDADSLEAAIWWPEDPVVDGDGFGETRHDNLDLRVYEPGGALVAKSEQAGSVFERATADVAGRKGTWVLDLAGSDFYDPKTFQVVYWMAAARKKR